MHSGKANLTSMKRVDKSFVDSGLVRNIVFEDDKAIVLELTFSNNPPITFTTLIDKVQLNFVEVGLQFGNNTDIIEGECNIFY